VNRLLVEGVDAGYGAVNVLRDISLDVREGELVALLGMNGNGKSTLLNSILGYVRPSRGQIVLEWDGERIDLLTLSPHAIVNRGIACVPEGRRLVPNLTVAENLILAGSCRRAKAKISDNLEYCFATFPILRERADQRAATMSGGQQQMLAIARALMTMPQVMIVDEPSVGLAPIVVDQVIATIRDLQKSSNLTILMAEQSFFQAIDVASRAYVLSHGAIIRTFEGGGAPIDHDEIRRAMMGV